MIRYMKIHKTEIPIADGDYRVEVPAGARFLPRVAWQGKTGDTKDGRRPFLSVWFMFDELNEHNSPQVVSLRVVGTGHWFPPGHTYLGTEIMGDGLVWHVLVKDDLWKR